MFSGIVEELGEVVKIEKTKDLARLTVKVRFVAKGNKIGDSIAINGVCLTVTSIGKGLLTFDVMRATLDCTATGLLRKGDRVNLERALKIGDRISGHFVTGHIDDVGIISDRIARKDYTEIRIKYPKPLRKFLVKKGSVCIDGISLTMGDVKPAYFSTYLIPYTKTVTTLGFKQKGDKVNLEADILAKYILNR